MNLIANISLNHCIGKDGKLAVRIPEDLKRFKELTTGNIVVMGANTFFGDLKGKPLDNRINVVLTKRASTLDYNYFKKYYNLYFVESIAELIPIVDIKKTRKVFIIGGAKVYQSFIDLVDTMYITHNKHIIKDGDSFLNVDWSKWDVEEVEFAENCNCTFVKYIRK